MVELQVHAVDDRITALALVDRLFCTLTEAK